jgi:hypothetical protein
VPSDYPKVPTYQELDFHGPRLTLNSLADEIDNSIEDPWERATDIESRDFLEGEYRVFRRRPTTDIPGLTLHITQLRDRIYVPNIVPTKARELSMEQYNAAVTEFYDRFAQPAAQALGGDAVLSEPVIDLETVIGQEPFRALVAFSHLANKSTGSSHPMDQRRWFDFIVLAHRSGAELTTDVLREWFILDGWSESRADDLVLEYEFGTGLLKHARSR